MKNQTSFLHSDSTEAPTHRAYCTEVVLVPMRRKLYCERPAIAPVWGDLVLKIITKYFSKLLVR
jgi:hypothetical protein